MERAMTPGTGAGELLTLTEAAALTKMSTCTFLVHQQRGDLPFEAIKLGASQRAHWRFRRLPVPERSGP
jgi:hypothetical protein